MLFWRIRTRYLLALAALFVGAAFLDLKQPGRGQFYNPVYGVRSWVNTHQPAAWQLVNRLSSEDARLQSCVAVAPDPVALDATKAELRKALVGETERSLWSGWGSLPVLWVTGSTAGPWTTAWPSM